MYCSRITSICLFNSPATHNSMGIFNGGRIVNTIMTQTIHYVLWKKAHSLCDGSLDHDSFSMISAEMFVSLFIQTHPSFLSHKRTVAALHIFARVRILFLSVSLLLVLLHSRCCPLHHFHSIRKYHAHQINRIAKILFILFLFGCVHVVITIILVCFQFRCSRSVWKWCNEYSFGLHTSPMFLFNVNTFILAHIIYISVHNS